MRTPILQKKIEEMYDLETNINTKKKISTIILIDECTSLGAAIFGNYIYGEFPIKQLKSFQCINSENGNKIIQKEEIKEYIELKNNKNENESLKVKIIKNIKEKIKKDKEYDRLIKEKSNKSKIIYKLKNYVTNKTHLKNESNKINKLERELRNIELTDIKLQSINSKLEQIYKDSYKKENDYITKFDKLIKILEEMKNSEIKEFFDEDNNEIVII